MRRLLHRALGMRALENRIAALEARCESLEARLPTLIDRAAWFVACEMIEGDYIEFGVYRGGSFVAAYRAFQNAFERRIAQVAGESGEDQRFRRRELADSMRFVALDSFEGLPRLEGVDRETHDFQAGQYSAPEALFRKNITTAGVPDARVVTITGWFSDTAKPKTWQRYGIERAAVIWIDGDLYRSAIDALNGVTPLVQDGTILVFDDWLAFRGNPDRGEQRAFAEWRQTMPDFQFIEFHREGVWRTSFIATRRI